MQQNIDIRDAPCHSRLFIVDVVRQTAQRTANARVGRRVCARIRVRHIDQREREQSLCLFLVGDCTMMIGTDLLSRCVDMSTVNVVINYDLPPDIATYMHRISRMGNAGFAISLYQCDADNDIQLAPHLVKVSCWARARNVLTRRPHHCRH
jgi:hypothetical protein